MSKPKQFSGVTKPRLFYDRKVSHYGYSRSVSMGHIIPEDWAYVRVIPLKISETTIVVEITKLLGKNKHAQTTPTHKTNK
mgnify:CR=1 FL=1